jgi:hypothetical protein
MIGAILFLAFVGFEGFLIYTGCVALAAAVPECLMVLVGLYIMAAWAVQDVWRWLTRGRRPAPRRVRYTRRASLDENGIPWLE